MGVSENVFVPCTLTDMYSKCGNIEDASEEARSMYCEIQDLASKWIILRIQLSYEFIQVRNGFGADIIANTALVEFYSKWGRIEDDQNVFERMPHKNVVSWNALISGYELRQLFECMICEGMCWKIGSPPNLEEKTPRMLLACTWIEIKKQRHVFFTRDKSHLQTKETYDNLAEVMLQISKHGYVPEGKKFAS
ncbi:hypothetical protein Pfo_011688 [Paulownia fortunei]|nr:hypothetical protein Pfo_011688 [Paulownia fortunei]